MSKSNCKTEPGTANWINSPAKSARRLRLLTLLAAGLAFGNLARGSQSVKLGWSASADPAASGYAVYYGNASGNYSQRVDAGTNVTALIAGLKEGQTNFFTITAYNSAGIEGPPAGEISYIVPGALSLARGATKNAPVTIGFALEPGHWYAVQASTNLTSWTNILQTATATSNYWASLQDTNTGKYPKRFYRLVLH